MNGRTFSQILASKERATITWVEVSFSEQISARTREFMVLNPDLAPLSSDLWFYFCFYS